MNANDLSHIYNTKGYMMSYKGKPIGGAGIDKFAKGCRSNLQLFKEQAELTKSELLNGYGNKITRDNILAIDNGGNL